MDPILRRFLDFFQVYIKICQLPSWPTETTSNEEILNAFKISDHIKKCLQRLKERSLTDDFLTVVTAENKQCTSSYFFQQCFSEPPRFILKKIVTSSCDIEQVDVAFKFFVELFSVDELEISLSQFMLEAASKDTLLKNLSSELSDDVLLDFKMKFLLTELKYSNVDDKLLDDMLCENCTEDTIELLVLSVLNNDVTYRSATKRIVNSFIRIMSSMHVKSKNFWKYLFKTDEKLIQLCTNNKKIFELVIKALVDVAQLIDKQMSMEYFYIEMTYSELKSALQNICRNETMKSVFFHYALEDRCFDERFWNDLLS